MKKDYLEMSDEEFSEHEFADEEQIEQEEEEESDSEDTEADDADSEVISTESNDDDEDSESDENTLDEDDIDEDEDLETEDEEESEDDSDEDELDDEEETTDSDEDEDKTTEDPVEFMNKILAPFKANDKEFTIDNAEEAITLIQQGANYNKKMLEIKPALGIVRALAKNNMLNDDDIDFFIDLKKGNKDAISKLLKDSDFDLIDYDEDAEVEYKSDGYVPDSATIEFEETIEKLSLKPTFDKFREYMSEMDEETGAMLFANPNLMIELEKDVASGDFEKIDKAINKNRALGKLDGVSYIDAYNTYSSLIADSSAKREEAKEIKLKSAAEKKANIKNRKKNISSKNRVRKQRPRKQEADEIDFLSMDDEEFEKYDAKFS